MKENTKKKNIITGIVCIIIASAIIIAPNYYMFRQSVEHQDRLYRESAIRQLSEIRGQLDEIYSLVYIEEAEDQILRDLKNLTYFRDNDNPYLKDFEITIEKETEPFYICKEISMQVNEKLDDIRRNQD